MRVLSAAAILGLVGAGGDVTQAVRTTLPALPPQRVLVVNKAADTIPVSAAQSGSWTVGITGTPTVISGESTQALLTQRYSSGSATVSSAVLDVSAYKSVRVGVHLLCTAGGCSNAHEIYVGESLYVNGSSDSSAFFTEAYTPSQDLEVVLDTPAPSLEIDGFCNPGPCLAMDVIVVARRN